MNKLVIALIMSLQAAPAFAGIYNTGGTIPKLLTNPVVPRQVAPILERKAPKPVIHYMPIRIYTPPVVTPTILIPAIPYKPMNDVHTDIDGFIIDADAVVM
jgi:hypothetical protein